MVFTMFWGAETHTHTHSLTDGHTREQNACGAKCFRWRRYTNVSSLPHRTRQKRLVSAWYHGAIILLAYYSSMRGTVCGGMLSMP